MRRTTIAREEARSLTTLGVTSIECYVGIYLHGRRLYITDATVPSSAPPQGHFQQSLGFIDEEGNRIRYDYDENWHLIRSR